MATKREMMKEIERLSVEALNKAIDRSNGEACTNKEFSAMTDGFLSPQSIANYNNYANGCTSLVGKFYDHQVRAQFTYAGKRESTKKYVSVDEYGNINNDDVITIHKTENLYKFTRA